jgi:DNA-binding transcriptional MerR regulator
MNLSPTEVARRFGVSIKALRLYEQRGLLKPLRSESGWRTYGPDQIARLHQILALKRLGLPLASIGQVLASADTLDTVLAIQEQVLARDSEKLARALDLVRAARAKLKAGQALSIDDLATLTQETVMTRPSAKELGKTLKPFVDRHISPEEKAAMRAKIIDREQVAKDWDGLMAEWQTLVQTGDPTSPAAQDMARRWSAFIEQFSAIDAEAKSKEKSIWKDAMNDPAAAEKLALYREIGAFAEQAIAHLKTLAK